VKATPSEHPPPLINPNPLINDPRTTAGVDSVIILDSTLRARIEALARELGVNSYYEVVNYLINYYYTTKRPNLCRVVTPWLVRWLINANSREWVRHALGPGLTRELERLGRELARECGGNNG